MKTLLVVLCVSLLLVNLSPAAVLEWDRNIEPDIQDYQVWACFIPGCVIVKSATTLQPGVVLQPAVGAKPSYTIDITNKEGAVSVSARDTSLNESGLSVSVPFDQRPPLTPTGVVIK